MNNKLPDAKTIFEIKWKIVPNIHDTCTNLQFELITFQVALDFLAVMFASLLCSAEL